ncbi:FIG00388958: hypothetical protein [hydrothermal vent metagenome]|uniref:Protein kinase domain-containing protein n=1 Tax=hydrothermal vent metagenome TaxID=652676 RepID=A0A1W1CNL4_9ZZZZ
MSYKYILNPKHTSFKEHLLNIQTIFQSSDKSIHKARNELKIIKIDGTKYVIKSFKTPHLLNRFVYSFVRDSKAKKSYLNAQKLQKLAINTPEPIGVIEFFEKGLLGESYFVSLYEAYDFTIREVFHHKVEDREKILKEFAAFTYELHKKGVWHVDYSLGNILITKLPNGDYRFSLVDINRMHFKTITPQEGLQNFNKFWAKEEDLAFLVKEYVKLSSLEFAPSFEIVQKSVKKIQKQKELKNYLKNKR